MHRRLFIAFSFGLVLTFSSGLQAQDLLALNTVSISQIAVQGSEMNNELVGVKTLNREERAVLQKSERNSSDQEWYDMVRVNSRSVFLQLEF